MDTFMKKNPHVLITLSFFFGALSVFGSEINLRGKKELVIEKEVRGQVLELSENLLMDHEDGFVEEIAGMDSPFLFDQSEAPMAEAEAVETVAPVINYDDGSVLRVVADNFSQQVSGTLVRGNTSFLQLKGGSLLRPGTSFPVSIPQAQDRSYTVTVTEITANSYTLRLGSKEEVIRLTGTSSAGGGATLSD
ncbi:MAG: hypothetical protein GVY36_07875 [Verrucomicrobia bacterium]|jgi:hypothetical protein|nr:hypothetical protein [Verrucomicrobiota bacterium]